MTEIVYLHDSIIRRFGHAKIEDLIEQTNCGTYHFMVGKRWPLGGKKSWLALLSFFSTPLPEKQPIFMENSMKFPKS